MKIGILQTGMVREELAGKYGEHPDMFKTLLDGHDFEFETFPVVKNIFPNSIDLCQGWLLTGSKHGAYEDHPWIPPLEDLIREIYAANIPMVGICFGHQIMAQALGGKVIQYHGQWGLGSQVYTHPDGSTSTLLAMHQDQVVEKPPEAEIIASNDFCKMAALAYKNRALSFQPHPEFTNEYMSELTQNLSGVTIPEEQAKAAMENMHLANDAHAYAQRIAQFFKGA